MKMRGIYLKKISVFSLFWVIIAIKAIIIPEIGVRNYFDYIIWGLALFFVFLNLTRNHIIGGFERDIFIGFFALFVVSIIGTCQNFTFHAFTCVVGVVCIGSFFIACSFITTSNQKIYFELFYIILLVRLLYRTFQGDYLGNSLPAFLLFSTLIYISLLLDNIVNDYNYLHGIFSKFYNFLVILISLGLMIYIGWNAASRTPVFTTIIIILCFLGLRIFKPKEAVLKKMYWVLIFFLIFGIYIYINISTYDWYVKLNNYSELYFHKNIDSSRSDIWRFSLESLKIWQFIVGSGTGALPTYSGYENSSFHNTYLQLLMQNGVIGLAFLVHIFKLVWYKLAEKSNDIVCQFIIAGFIGIIVFNVFECTLLQNKAFVGLTEWMFLSVGIIRIRSLDRDQNILLI